MSDWTRDEIEQALHLARQAGDAPAMIQLTNRLRKSIFDPARDMGAGERVAANIGAGMDYVLQGGKQLLGVGTGADMREKEALDQRLAESTDFGGLLQAGGSAAMLAPLAMVTPATLPGAAVAGGAAGLLSPTTDDNVVLGKVKNTAGGAGLGTGFQYGLNRLGQAAPGMVQGSKEWLAARGMLPGGAAVRQDMAERALRDALSDPQQARLDLMSYNPRIPGMQPSTGAVLQDQGLLAMERRLAEKGGVLGNPIRQQEVANNQTAYQFAESKFNKDAQSAWQAASDFADAAKSKMVPRTRGVNVVFEDLSKPVGKLFELENSTTNPTFKAELGKVRERISEAWDMARQNPRAGLEELHQIRMTALDDVIGRLSQTDSKAAGTLNRHLQDVKGQLDNALNAGLTGKNTWSKFLTGYRTRATYAGQLDAGNALIGKIRSAAPTYMDDPSMPSSVGMLRKIEEQGGLVDRYGQQVYTPEAEAAIAALRGDVGDMRRAYSIGVGAKGSATAENQARPASRLVDNAEAAIKQAESVTGQQALTGVGLTLAGHPVAASGALVKHFVLDKMHAKAATDIATRMLTVYRDPNLAYQALERLSLPAPIKKYAAIELSKRAAGALGGAAAPALLSYEQQ